MWLLSNWKLVVMLVLLLGGIGWGEIRYHQGFNAGIDKQKADDAEAALDDIDNVIDIRYGQNEVRNNRPDPVGIKRVLHKGQL